MKNCPVVAHYIESEDDFGGHDQDVVTGSDGNYKLVNLTEPLGVVPESANWWWETIEDSGGQHEYICTDVILWKRQRGYSKIVENGITAQSMEISVDSFEDNGDYMDIHSFTFLAFCLLSNENVEPCFEGASLAVFSKDEFQNEFREMLSELKMSLDNNCFAFGQNQDIETKMEKEEKGLDK